MPTRIVEESKPIEETVEKKPGGAIQQHEAKLQRSVSHPASGSASAKK